MDNKIKRILFFIFFLLIGGSIFSKSPDFTAYDQYGNLHHLEAYQGKTVFLTFWLTWCPHCLKELDDLESFYQENGKNTGDVIVLTIADPKSEAYPKNRDKTKEEILEFIHTKKYTFPVIFDTKHELHTVYQANKAPTSIFISPEGEILASIVGSLTKENMQELVEGSKQGKVQQILIRLQEEKAKEKEKENKK